MTNYSLSQDSLIRELLLEENKLPLVIQCGAGIGEEVSFLNSMFKKAILLEANSSLIPEIQRRVEGRTGTEFVIRQQLLSSSNGSFSFTRRSAYFTSSMKKMTPLHRELVPLSEDTLEENLIGRTLDSLFSEQENQLFVPFLNLLIVDCEGSDLDVLRGGTRLLQRTQFVSTEIVLEPLYENQPCLGEVKEWMFRQGFELQSILWWTNKLGDAYFKKNL